LTFNFFVLTKKEKEKEKPESSSVLTANKCFNVRLTFGFTAMESGTFEYVILFFFGFG